MERKQAQPHYVYENFHVDHPSTIGSCLPFHGQHTSKGCHLRRKCLPPKACSRMGVRHGEGNEDPTFASGPVKNQPVCELKEYAKKPNAYL